MAPVRRQEAAVLGVVELKLITAFGQIPCAFSESKDFTKDSAQEGHHLEAAIVHCSSSLQASNTVSASDVNPPQLHYIPLTQVEHRLDIHKS